MLHRADHVDQLSQALFQNKSFYYYCFACLIIAKSVSK